MSEVNISDTWRQPDRIQINSDPMKHQIGGNHYRHLAIQPVEYIHRNNLGFCEGSIIKYVTRWRNKNGIKDLEKAKHFIELLIEMEKKDDISDNNP